MKSKDQSIWEELELGFGCGSKFRILTYIILNPEKAFTKYALAKATELRTPSVQRQLRVLLELGWVKEYHFTPKTYQINLENKVVNHVYELFQKLKYLQKRS